MKRRTYQPFLLIVCILASCVFAGCTSQHTFEFKHGKSGELIANAPVVISSWPRGYSFIDIRHYIYGCSTTFAEEGQTDTDGKATLSLPSDVGVQNVCLNGEWFASDLSTVWQPMLTQQEAEAKTAESSALEVRQDRPLVRMLK